MVHILSVPLIHLSLKLFWLNILSLNSVHTWHLSVVVSFTSPSILVSQSSHVTVWYSWSYSLIYFMCVTCFDFPAIGWLTGGSMEASVHYLRSLKLLSHMIIWVVAVPRLQTARECGSSGEKAKNCVPKPACFLILFCMMRAHTCCAPNAEPRLL